MLRTTKKISNLTFISKVVERLIFHHLVAFLDANGLLPLLQSAYRKHHSTETAVLKVISDTLLAADRGEVTLLCLLDLFAAFDMVDHDIIDWLQTAFGIHGTVLSWISSFLKDKTQTVTLAGLRSNTSDVKCGMPQGSVLGPVLFLLYTTEVTAIASCVDDTQLHIHRMVEDLQSSIPYLVTCIDEINCMMSANYLKLNTDKTPFCWVPDSSSSKWNANSTPLMAFSKDVTCLGIGVRQRIEIFFTFQAFGRKMHLPSASDKFCVPLVIRRCGINASQCIHNK